MNNFKKNKGNHLKYIILSNRGITITSVVIYIAIVFVVLAAVMRITTYFSNNIKDIADITFESEFDKINLYLIDESERNDNSIDSIDDSQISFTTGNKYTYNVEEKCIYLNDTIKICENVDNCIFEQKSAENGKIVFVLTITIGNKTKNIEYTLSRTSHEEEKIEIDDYLSGGSLASYYLEVGDYVDYNPDIGTYKVADGENGSGIDVTSTGYQEFTTETGVKSLEWRVLSIDEKTGNIELISATVRQPLSLYGVNGYNHGVDILNDLCETLYSKTVQGVKVATGRSINVEDINKKTTYDYTKYTDYGEVLTYTSNKYYPKLYAAELGSTSNGLNETTKLINESEGVEKGTVNTSGVTNYTKYIGLDTATTLYATNTFYQYIPENYLNTSLGINTAPTGLININSTYWVASRCGKHDSNNAYFYIRVMLSSGSLNIGNHLINSGGNNNGNTIYVRPVVSLSVNSFDFSVGDGSENDPWGMK